MIGAVFLQRILKNAPLPLVGGVVTVRANVDTKGNHHIDLGLLDGLQDEMRKVTIGGVQPDALYSYVKSGCIRFSAPKQPKNSLPLSACSWEEWGVVVKAHLGKLGHNLNIGDDVLQCGVAVRIQGAIGRVSHPIERLLELWVLCEVAWVVWIVLMPRVAVARVVGTVVARGAVVVRAPV